nr:MAG TPA: hypothetical protein [Caudoviricetes sp.]
MFFKIYTYILMAIFSHFEPYISVLKVIKNIFFVYNSYF